LLSLEKIDDGLIKEEYKKFEKVTENIGLGDNCTG
jgi:hypothetical protein